MGLNSKQEIRYDRSIDKLTDEQQATTIIQGQLCITKCYLKNKKRYRLVKIKKIDVSASNVFIY